MYNQGGKSSRRKSLNSLSHLKTNFRSTEFLENIQRGVFVQQIWLRVSSTLLHCSCTYCSRFVAYLVRYDTTWYTGICIGASCHFPEKNCDLSATSSTIYVGWFVLFLLPLPTCALKMCLRHHRYYIQRFRTAIKSINTWREIQRSNNVKNAQPPPLVLQHYSPQNFWAISILHVGQDPSPPASLWGALWGASGQTGHSGGYTLHTTY